MARSRKRSKSHKRSKSGKRNTRSRWTSRRFRSPSHAARAACVAKGMLSYKRKGSVHCRKVRSRKREYGISRSLTAIRERQYDSWKKVKLRLHAERYAPTNMDLLESKKVKTLRRIAKSKGVKNFSKKKKHSLIQAIMSH